MDGDRGITELLRIAIDYLQWINDDIAIVENFDVDSFLDKGCFDIEDFDREWNETVDELNTILEDDKYLTMLIEYLKVEYHAKHNIDPQIKIFRDSLVGLVTKFDSYFPNIVMPGAGKAERNPKEEFLKDKFCENFLADEYADWIGWIDRYFPPEQSKQEQDNEEPVKQDEDLRSCFLVQDDKKNELLNKLHSLIDGKKGKSVALVIHLCVELGLMSKPTFGVLEAEFGNIGNASGFNSYYGKYEKSYTKEEKDGLKRHFEPFLEYI